MIFESETPLPGSKCNNMIDPLGGVVCGKPAVLILIPKDMPDIDEDDRMILCEGCRIERLRREARNDQEHAFETEHGWPPGMDVLDLAYSLGMTEIRFQELLDKNAPSVITKNERVIRIRREERVLAWLEAHPPSEEHGTHLRAINALTKSFEENYDKENPESSRCRTVRAGLKRVRELGSLIDEEALPPREGGQTAF
jgi:hypothetical protein